MAEEYVTRRRVLRDGDEIVEDVPASTGRGVVGFQLAQIVYFIGGLIEALLALRFVLVLLGASRASSFVDFIYNLSAPLVAPFFGMFATSPSFGVSRLEVETLVAILVYAVIAYLVARLVEFIP